METAALKGLGPSMTPGLLGVPARAFSLLWACIPHGLSLVKWIHTNEIKAS